MYVCACVRTYHSYEKQPLHETSSTVRTERGSGSWSWSEEDPESGFRGAEIKLFELSSLTISFNSTFLLFFW